MAVKGGPDIETDGLVFNLDAAGAVSDKGYPINGLPVEYLIVAGGGAGGRHHGGGGGAGGLLHGYTKASLSTGSYTVVVGAGGAKNTGTNSSPGGAGGNGQNSSAFGLTSIGGGGGGQYNANGANGGSGGGPTNWSTSRLAGTSTSGQGYNAINGSSLVNTRGGGGGSGGSPTSANNYNNGGIGRYFGYSFGRSLGEDGWFAGGGAAGTYGPTCGSTTYGRYTGANIGGKGGGAIGGYGCHGNAVHAANGQANTGGGGGGQPAYNRLGGNGGSGVVIIKYKGPQKATGGDSIITRRGYTIHVFTSSGTFTVGGKVGGLSTSKIVGTLENMGPSDYSTGNKGYFSFDGSNQYIQTPVTAGNLGISSAGGKFSIDIWYRDNSNGSTSRALFTTFRGYNADIEIQANSTYRFYVSVQDNNGDRASFSTTNNSYTSGEWVNGVLVWDGSVTTIYCYLNGELQGSDTDTLVNNIFEYANDPIPFRVGSTTVPNYQYGALPLLGDVASVKVYDNVALSEKQIKDNYNATKGRFGL